MYFVIETEEQAIVAAFNTRDEAQRFIHERADYIFMSFVIAEVITQA